MRREEDWKLSVSWNGWRQIVLAVAVLALYSPWGNLHAEEVEARAEEAASAALPERLPVPPLDPSIVTVPSVESRLKSGRTSEPLTLRAALLRTLEGNRTLAVQRLTPLGQQASTYAARGAFDPKSSLSYNRSRQTNPTGSQLDGARISRTDSRRAALGLYEQAFRDGSSVNVDVNLDRFESNSLFRTLNPSYTGRLNVTVRRPLLRGGGRDVASATLRLAKVAEKRSHWTLVRQVIETLSQAERAYWQLVLAHADLHVNRLALTQAKAVHEGNVARYELGAMPITEVLQSRAGVATRMESVVQAEDNLLDAEARLRRLMGEIDLGDDTGIQPVDRPVFEEVRPDRDAMLRAAFSLRPDYKEAMLDLESRRIQVARARDGTLPKVDLVASYGLNGLTGSPASTFDQINTREFPSWNIGLTVEVPWGNRAARAERRQREIEVQKALLSIKNLEEQIQLEVEEAVRQVVTNASRVRAAGLAREAAEAKLEAEEERFRQGLLASFQLLRFQEELAQARSADVRAQADFRTSLVELDSATGRTLKVKGVGIDAAPIHRAEVSPATEVSSATEAEKPASAPPDEASAPQAAPRTPGWMKYVEEIRARHRQR